MTDADAVNLVLLVLRVAVGVVMLAHGINHVFRGGKIAGTAKWFGSMGMRPPVVQAWLASITELGSGALLLLGLLTPLAAAGVMGVMAVAFTITHRKNGFFIFRPGEGYEYVMTLFFCAVAIATVGPGEWSLDDAFGIRDDLTGTTGLLVALAAGVGGAILLLAVAWRPRRQPHAS